MAKRTIRTMRRRGQLPYHNESALGGWNKVSKNGDIKLYVGGKEVGTVDSLNVEHGIVSKPGKSGTGLLR